jgi:hypothetical protein
MAMMNGRLADNKCGAGHAWQAADFGLQGHRLSLPMPDEFP